MKKTPPKLVLRRETLRMLTHQELARAAGGLNTGAEPALFDSGLKACTSTALFDSGDKACTYTAAVATTAGG